MLGWDPETGAEPSAGEISESCPAQELRAVQTLLWEELAKRIPEAERDEVQRVIGSSRIDENQQLFDEASALAEIVGDVRLRTDACTQRRHSALLQTPQREMVENGLRLLLDNIQRVAAGNLASSASQSPQAAVESLVAKDRKERLIYQYVSMAQPALGASGPRPATPRTPPSRPLSSCGSRPSTAGTFASNGSLDSAQVIEAVQPKLNAFDIDAVTAFLRDALKVEHDALLEDIEYLHQCLESEAELHSTASQPPPTLTDLTQYSEKLQDTWIKESEKHEHAEKVQRMFQATETADGQGNSARKLRAMVGVSRSDDGPDFRPPSRSASFGSPLLHAGSGVSSLTAAEPEGFDRLRLSRTSSLRSGEATSLPPVATSPRLSATKARADHSRRSAAAEVIPKSLHTTGLGEAGMMDSPSKAHSTLTPSMTPVRPPLPSSGPCGGTPVRLQPTGHPEGSLGSSPRTMYAKPHPPRQHQQPGLAADRAREGHPR